MTNRKLFLFLLIVHLFVFIVECKEERNIESGSKHISSRKSTTVKRKPTTTESITNTPFWKSRHKITRRSTKPPVIVSSTIQSPQYAYINQCRKSDSRYGDLLTGLAIYNMARSHIHYREHYYHDDFYINWHKIEKPNSGVTEEVTCTLITTENGEENYLKIPCEIVSTFTKDGEEIKLVNTLINSTVCTTHSIIIKTNMPANISSVNQSLINSSVIHRLLGTANILAPINNITIMRTVNSTDRSSVQQPTNTVAVSKLNSTTERRTVDNVKAVNVTLCTPPTNIMDPLTVKGPRLNSSDIECAVDIRTETSLIRKKINCNTLLEYAKMPLPKKETDVLLPSRKKLKSWLSNPPWWTSIFITV